MDSTKKTVKLDIGCGKHKKEGFIGIDIDKDSQADIIASALDLPFDDNSVDEIYSSHLVEHFSPAQAKKFFAEIYRVLKKDGWASLKIDTDWTKKRLLKKDLTHQHRYSIREIKKIIGQFNFSRSKIVKEIYLIDWHLRNKIFVDLLK